MTVIIYKNTRADSVLKYQLHLAAKEEQKPRPSRQKQNPIAVARVWLGNRLVEKPSGYWLDGVPVNLDTFMRETNLVLKANGAEQIGPDQWRVP
jgi:hypothetical protein